MSEMGVEPLSLLPDRLAIAGFGPETEEQVLGYIPEFKDLSRENYNWLAAYLVEIAGLHESEVGEWMQSQYKGLGDQTPLGRWNTPNGFFDVFEYAKEYKRKVDLAMADEPDVPEPWYKRSHELAHDALRIIQPGLGNVLGLEASLLADSNGRRAVWVPQGNLMISWKRQSGMEDYRVRLVTGEHKSTYYIVHGLRPDLPSIMQSGIMHSFRGETDMYAPGTSDIDGRPPSAGEIASFVIPVANAVKSGNLVEYSAQR